MATEPAKQKAAKAAGHAVKAAGNARAAVENGTGALETATEEAVVQAARATATINMKKMGDGFLALGITVYAAGMAYLKFREAYDSSSS